jgi:hypothetical protein
MAHSGQATMAGAGAVLCAFGGATDFNSNDRAGAEAGAVHSYVRSATFAA